MGQNVNETRGTGIRSGTDSLFGASASATWALPGRREGVVLRIQVLAYGLAHTDLSFVSSHAVFLPFFLL